MRHGQELSKVIRPNKYDWPAGHGSPEVYEVGSKSEYVHSCESITVEDVNGTLYIKAVPTPGWGDHAEIFPFALATEIHTIEQGEIR